MLVMMVNDDESVVMMMMMPAEHNNEVALVSEDQPISSSGEVEIDQKKTLRRAWFPPPSLFSPRRGVFDANPGSVLHHGHHLIITLDLFWKLLSCLKPPGPLKVAPRDQVSAF